MNEPAAAPLFCATGKRNKSIKRLLTINQITGDVPGPPLEKGFSFLLQNQRGDVMTFCGPLKTMWDNCQGTLNEKNPKITSETAALVL